MQIGHTELFVRDPAASRDFYERVLGFEVVAVQHDGRIVWLRLGDAQILLRPGPAPAAAADYQHAGRAIVLYCDDLDATLRTLAGRGLVLRGDDGPGCPTFTDPDGHWYQLVDPRHA